jgi:hypothetical protein
MIAFLTFSTLPDALRPFTDARPDGLFLWPEAAHSLGIFLVNWFHVVLHYGLVVVGLCTVWRASAARYFARVVFVCAGLLLVIGLLTPDGLWLVAANWPADVQGNTVRPVAGASWSGFIPTDPPDDLIDAIVAASGFVFGYLPIGLRPWRYWTPKRG